MSGNTHELQWRRSHARRWFMEMADRTRSSELRRQRRRDDTVQGMFIAGADGTSYGWRNDKNPREISDFMDEALERFRRRPPKRVTIPAHLLQVPFARTPDPSTSVVRVFSRIRPVPPGADPRNLDVGRDHLWVLAEEVRALRSAGR